MRTVLPSGSPTTATRPEAGVERGFVTVVTVADHLLVFSVHGGFPVLPVHEELYDGPVAARRLFPFQVSPERG